MSPLTAPGKNNRTVPAPHGNTPLGISCNKPHPTEEKGSKGSTHAEKLYELARDTQSLNGFAVEGYSDRSVEEKLVSVISDIVFLLSYLTRLRMSSRRTGYVAVLGHVRVLFGKSLHLSLLNLLETG